MVRIFKSISDFILDPYALIWCTGKVALVGIYLAFLCLWYTLESSADVPRAVFWSQSWTHLSTATSPPIPNGSMPSIRQFSPYAWYTSGKSSWQEMSLQWAQCRHSSRTTMDFVKLNTPPSLFLLHQVMAFLLRLGLFGRTCSHSHGT